MNEKLIKIVWCVCIMLTILASGWPMFNNGYMTVIWVLSAISSIILTDAMLTKASHIDYDFQLICSIITTMCILFTIISALVVIWGWLNEINDNFITLAKCMIHMLYPIGIITNNIATWKPKK